MSHYFKRSKSETQPCSSWGCLESVAKVGTPRHAAELYYCAECDRWLKWLSKSLASELMGGGF
jgi:hypothetical protein